MDRAFGDAVKTGVRTVFAIFVVKTLATIAVLGLIAWLIAAHVGAR